MVPAPPCPASSGGKRARSTSSTTSGPRSNLGSSLSAFDTSLSTASLGSSRCSGAGFNSSSTLRSVGDESKTLVSGRPSTSTGSAAETTGADDVVVSVEESPGTASVGRPEHADAASTNAISDGAIRNFMTNTMMTAAHRSTAAPREVRAATLTEWVIPVRPFGHSNSFSWRP
jgi:hypothetical protein